MSKTSILAIKKKSVQAMIKAASAYELELVWIPKIIHEQTAAELSHDRTEEDNGVGLTGVDAPFMSHIYKQIQGGAHLTEKQAVAVQRILQKYWSQFANVMQWGAIISPNSVPQTKHAKTCVGCDNYYGSDIQCLVACSSVQVEA